MPTLLVIDDEPAICALIRRVAEPCGYRVTEVSDFETFASVLAKGRPDVIGLDLSMPGTDGVELLRYLAARNCTAQLLIVSGYASPMVGAAVRLGEAMGLRIAAVLPKPIRIAELRDILLTLGQPQRPAA